MGLSSDDLDDYARYLAKDAVESVEYLTVFEAFEEYASENGFDGVQLSDLDASNVCVALGELARVFA